MIAQHHGLKYPKHVIRSICQQDRGGATLSMIAKGAQALGFRTLAVRVPFADLSQRASLPCIAYLTHGHFVVVYRVHRNRVYVADPAAGPTIYTKEEFETCWLEEGANRAWGVLLLCETDGLPKEIGLTEEAGRKVDLWGPVWRDVRKHVIPILVGVCLTLFAQLIVPFLSAAVVDLGIRNRSLNVVYLLLCAQAVLMLSNVSVGIVQGWTTAYISLRIDISLVRQFLIKLTRLPIAFFDGRLVGDMMQRVNDHKLIQTFLTGGLLQVVFALLSLLVFGTVLAIFKPALFAIYVAGSVAYLVYCALFFRKYRVLGNKQFRISAKKQGLIIEFLAGMQEIKLNNAEEQRRWDWESAQYSLSRLEVKSRLLNQFHSGGATVINELKNLLLTLLSVRAVIRGEMSLGTMVAIQYIVGQLTWPLGQIADLLARSHEASLSYERAHEIHCLADEEKGSHLCALPEEGDIEFRDVTFGYGGSNPRPLFQNLNLRIPRGKVTAIVGASGSGKTTLLKILLKFYSVTGGEIQLGGVNLENISPRSWREQCGIVMQDGYIFSDTILNNIAVTESCADLDRIREVAEITQIRSFIERLSLGYNTRIGRDGLGISRGQAQRILIARALYKNPHYLLFDEATSALDSLVESDIVTHLRQTTAGKTMIIVAHRMSTVRHADQIIVLDAGKVTEVGRHEELVAARNCYFRLVQNQLEVGI
jgi:ATP-binding cassette subfamily B protein